MRPSLGDLVAVLLWLCLLLFAAWFLLWTMGSWVSLFLPDISWIPWPL